VALKERDNLLLKSDVGKLYSVHSNRVKLAPFAEQFFRSLSGPEQDDSSFSTTSNQKPDVPTEDKPMWPLDSSDCEPELSLRFGRDIPKPATVAKHKKTVRFAPSDEFISKSPDPNDITTPATTDIPETSSASPTKRLTTAIRDIVPKTRAQLKAAGLVAPSLFPFGRKEQDKQETRESES
jgi:hypothetical protein